jgi:hypothetical protein
VFNFPEEWLNFWLITSFSSLRQFGCEMSIQLFDWKAFDNSKRIHFLSIFGIMIHYLHKSNISTHTHKHIVHNIVNLYRYICLKEQKQQINVVVGIPYSVQSFFSFIIISRATNMHLLGWIGSVRNF